MKQLYTRPETLLAILMLFIQVLSEAQAPVVLTFTHTGAVQTFTMPPCVGSMTIEAKGAGGGTGSSSSNPGAGGSVKAVMTATAGQVLYINVGGQGSLTAGGFNGGGNGGVGAASNGGGGGGASDIRLGSNALAARIMIAAGGGGSGGNGYGGPYNPYGGNGGGGSAFSSASGFGGQAGQSSCGSSNNGGESGGSAPTYGTGGGGAGYLSGGGGGGQGVGTGGGWGCNGALGVGGEGGSITYGCGGTATSQNGGGGGGGGVYGGGGGMSGTGGCNGGGGGGSSYCNNSLFTSISYTAGNVSNHGTVTITFSYLGALTNVSVTPNAICTGNSATLTASGVTSYTWSTGSNSNSIVVSPASTTAYTVSGTNTLGCVSSAVVTVTVSTSPPSLSVNSSTNSVCPTNTVVLTASGALTYTWSGGITNGVPFSPLVTTAYTVVGQNGCGINSSVTTITVTPLPVLAFSSSSIVCAGNTATLSAGGATSYTWQPGSLTGANVVVSPSSNTNYTVTGVTGVCAGITTVAVNTNPNPTVTASASNSIICGGESVTLTATGAIGYTWQPGNLTGATIVVNPASPTAYFVTGNNSFGCTSTAQQPVIAFASPTINIVSSTPTICAGGSAILYAGGANTYTWSTGSNTSSLSVSPASATIYSVAGTNTTTQCSSGNTFEVHVLNASVSVSSSTALCLGASATLVASGADSYQWSTGASGNSIAVTPQSSASYTVTGLVNAGSISCSASAVSSITVNPLPTLSVVATRTNICKNESTKITSSGASNYLWSNSATTASISVSPTINTTYTVEGTDNNGCKNTTTLLIRVFGCVGWDENSSGNTAIQVYPNPSHGVVHIAANHDCQLLLSNELGQLVQLIQLSAENNYTAEIKNLNSGLYILNSADPRLNYYKKIVIRN